MRVIKMGNEKVYKTSCHNCKSDLEYNKEDVFEKSYFHKSVHFWGKEEEVKKQIKCPICGTLLDAIY